MTPACEFTREEWAVLSATLRLKPAADADRRRTLTPGALLAEDTCRQLLTALGPIIGAPTPAITASLLGKRLSFLLTGACLYAMSAYDKGLDLSPENSLIEYGHDDGRWTSSMPLRVLTPATYAAGTRHAWRERIAGALFAGLLAPLWQTFGRASGLAPRVLWENTAVRVYSLYERRMSALTDPRVRSRCAGDFEWLINRAEPVLFGLEYNPLKHFRRSLTAVEGGTRYVRFRRTCCFYYKASQPVEYCATCPLRRLVKGR